MILAKKLRLEKGWSQAKLAREAEVNQVSISMIELGKEPAFPKRGKRIADALDWEGDPDDIFKEVED